jgi:hypothetical protein
VTTVGDCHAIVTLIVTEQKAYLSGFFGNVTVVTLVTVKCRCFLSAGVALHSPSAQLRVEGDTVHLEAL